VDDAGSADGARLGIVDYGMGNRRSVEKALQSVGARVTVSADPTTLRRADGLVVPGVGAFPRAMERLNQLGLAELIRERLAAGTPVLGICLGMQLAFDRSSELGGAEGLGLVAGTVAPLRAPGLKLPHIGWCPVSFQPDSELVEGLPSQSAFYHVHSLAPNPTAEQDVLGTASYGSRFVTAVAHGDFYGVQFHPEKSSTHGLRLLANFGSICLRARR
jgi:glutamine amidotransferase